MPHICSPSKLISCVLSYSLVRLKIHSSHRSTELARRAICPSLQTCSSRIRCPMTVLFIPALLPMIPGMYAYKTVFATIMFMQHLGDAAASAQYLQEILRNGFVTFCVIFMLAAGAAAPIFLFNKRAHSLTRDKKHISEQ